MNKVKLVFPSKSSNEGFARTVAGAFAAQLDPTFEELSDIKAAVSEAVTNCVVHAYPEKIGDIEMTLWEETSGMTATCAKFLYIKIRDKGVGIENVEQAMAPMFTSSESGERAGLGFAVMESFMDKLTVKSKQGMGTIVTLCKKIKPRMG